MTNEDYGKINLAEFFVKKTDLATTVQDGLMSAADKIKLDNLQNIEASINWNNITNKPNSFTPSDHTHQKSDITDFNHSHGDIDENGVISNGNSGDILILGVGNRITSSASIDANKIQNLKTINNESIVGSGNITISGGTGTISGSGEQNVFYGTCSTTGVTQTKVISVDDWSFTTGNILFVKFTNANSYDGITKISIGGTEKNIVAMETDETSRFYWRPGELVGFVYDGTNMLMLEGGVASTTYYGITKLSNSIASNSSTTAASSYAVREAYNLADSKANSVHTHTVLDVTDLPDHIPSKTSDLTNDSGFLTSHQSLKTINNESIVGTGNINVVTGSHTHTSSNITDMETVELLITYTDETSETLTLFKQTNGS